MKTADFDYLLPDELIAQTPAEPRDHSKLMVVSRAAGATSHRRFYELPDLVREGDVLMFNDSRVVPARLYGRRDGTGARVEMLLLGRLRDGAWRALVRPGRRMREGATFRVEADRGADGLTGEIVGVEPDGSRRLRLSSDELRGVGVVPLPPYIRAPLEDEERYQTVYSRVEGSVAAPTAGLHFTPGLLDRLRGAGVETVFVTLHVGWDSFRPVKVEEPADHPMHSEQWTLGAEAADAINRAKREGRRVGDAARRRSGARRLRVGWPVHTSRAPVSDGRRPDYQLPPAEVDAADADLRPRGAGARPAGVRRGGQAPVPLLLVWGRDADRLSSLPIW